MPKVGIIGGKGLLGRWFANFFREQGVTVFISDLESELSNKELVERVDIVLVSVPIRVTEDVIREVAPMIGSHQMLADLTSLKSKPVMAMLQSKGEVLGLHPMFGPPIDSIAGQTVIVCRARPAKYTEWLLALLSGAGARLKPSTPEDHDRMMAVIQGLNHISTIALASALFRLGVDLSDSLEYSSPVYRMRMDLVARIMAQDAGLYTDIALENPKTEEVVTALHQSTTEILEFIRGSKRDDFLKLFHEASTHLGDFRRHGLQESDLLIKYLASLIAK